MITDKLTVTRQLSEELSGISGKAAFMPADEIGKALQYLEANGIPNNKTEAYKYCNTESFIRKEFKSLEGKEIHAAQDIRKQFHVEGAYNIYLVNGRISSAHSEVPEQAVLTSITDAPADELRKHLAAYAASDSDPFAALNTAYADRGTFLRIPAGTVIGKTIVLHNLLRTEGKLFFNVRNLFVIEKNARVKITEVLYDSPGKVFVNVLTEVFTGEHAQVQYVQVQHAGADFYGIQTTQVLQNQYSNFSHSVFTFSGSLVRNNLSFTLNEAYAECHLNGLALSRNSQVVDNHTRVDHQKPHCQSNELYKGIAADRSTLTFNGQIFVERDAQKTNAYQSSKNILLSNDATINAKPELEIYANDVKCSHGTSTGKVDENALFYLKSRGIGDAGARKLLLHAFAQEVIGKINDRDTALFVENLFEQSLN